MSNARFNQTKLMDVRHYGAVGDGVTNDSAAFAAAVAAGGPVRVPAGTFVTSFDLGNNQILEGVGAKGQTVLKPPAGATYVVRVNASTSAKQHCQVRDLSIQNPGAVANCVGLLFKADNVSDINDWHTVRNVTIDGFARGIEVLGRQIWSSYYNVEVTGCTVGINVSTDAATPAFNQNTFTQCQVTGCTAEGVKIVGQNTTIAFYTCNFEVCNTADTLGVAAVYVEDSEEMSFIGCYWEDNGGGAVVNNVTIANNSVGLKFAGTYCYNPKIAQAYFVGSGVLVWVAASLRGGVLENSRLDPLTGGYALHITAALAANGNATFVYDATNFNPNGLISIVQDVNGNFAGSVRQASSCLYITATQTIDLATCSKIVNNAAGAIALTTIKHRIPGMELTIYNNSAATLTIDAALVWIGSGAIATATSKRFIVAGFPNAGKLIAL
jgi:hypothetical protein